MKLKNLQGFENLAGCGYNFFSDKRKISPKTPLAVTEAPAPAP
jgi:hypothetical protein